MTLSFKCPYNYVVPTYYDAALMYLGKNLHSAIKINLERNPHIAIFGSTGSGKTYASLLLLARIAKSFPESVIVIADFKGDSAYNFLDGHASFFRYQEVGQWFEMAIHEFEYRQKTLKDGDELHPVFFYFDELAAYLTSLDKAEESLRIKQLSLLLMLGRSLGVHIIVSQQRPDAVYFGKARDNFGVVMNLGTMSKEVLSMLFSDYAEEIERNQPRGIGYMNIDGVGLKKLIVPIVRTNPNCVESYISRLVKSPRHLSK